MDTVGLTVLAKALFVTYLADITGLSYTANALFLDVMAGTLRFISIGLLATLLVWRCLTGCYVQDCLVLLAFLPAVEGTHPFLLLSTKSGIWLVCPKHGIGDSVDREKQLKYPAIWKGSYAILTVLFPLGGLLDMQIYSSAAQFSLAS